MNKKQVAAYPQAKLEGMGRGKRYIRWMLTGFQPWLKGSICEVGAGMGHVSPFLMQDEVEDIVSLEPDKGLFKELYNVTEGFSSISVVNSTLADFVVANPSKRIDVFIYINVMEHIEHDLDELLLTFETLSPGGAILIFVPALPVLYSTYDRNVGHWRRYTKTELREKMERAGFEIEDLRYFDFIGAFVWFFACRLFRLQPSGGNVGFYDRLLVPFSRFVEARWRPVFGKNLLCVGIKKEA